MRVCLYVRVSTAKQAERDLSLPDQLKQLRGWCKANGRVVVKEYVEEGVSGTTDQRPEFQKMISEAIKTPSPYDAVLVYDLSRFFRNVELQGKYIRILEAARVKLISITQQFQQGATGDFLANVLGSTNAFYSAQLGERVKGAMVENASRGYVNGSRPPYGYKTVETQDIGKQGLKKRYAVDPAEAGIVKKVFALYLTGYKGKTLGTKAIAAHLNERGITRRGQKWTRSKTHELLSERAYIGELFYNKYNSKLKVKRPASEWVLIKVEPIVSVDVFLRAEKRRHSSSPKVTAPRLVNSPTLLTGLLKCGRCGAGLTTATGKGGRYRYYKCFTRLGKHNNGCDCPNLPMEKMDTLVLNKVADNVLFPERVALIMAEMRKREKAGQSDGDVMLGKLQRELNAVNVAINRLTGAIEKGIAISEEIVARSHSLRTRKQDITLEMASLRGKKEMPLKNLNPKHLAEATAALKAILLDKEGGFSKKYLKAIVRVITVKGRTARIEGDNGDLVKVIKSGRERVDTVPSIAPSWPTI